ncbi:hypothetical protein PC115_g11005 [Phytophthora cactorum]|uniref:Protein kinase domain-containing protein n=1 Tax=Phytophthora cactorum TaxID=29920 RepID=A0A8T1CBU8_9STRA|nr:hypothetical protein PC115_g11005 [Phytophthora cactorum]
MMAAKLDDYLIQRRLAPALFGDVLLCQHKPTGDMVAVKRVLQSAANAQLTLASNKKVRENVALERALYHQLNRVGGHRNLLKLRDEIEFDGYLYLVSDFCARGELYELVSSAADGKLPLPIITNSITSPQRIVAPKMQQTRVASPAKQTPQPTASYSSAPSTTMYSTRPESDGIERSGCRLLFHKIHRFFSRRHNKRVMAVRRGSGSSKRAHAKRLANAA